jgi:hypothetical protein
VLLTGFLACVTLLGLLFFLEASLLPTERLYALFLQNTVLGAAIVLLLQFAYRFPNPFPHQWEARLALGLSLVYALYEALYAAYRFWLVSAWGQVVFRPSWADYPMALGLLWAPVIFARQSVRASGQPRALPLQHLWRPQGRAARTARALALVYLLPFGLSLLTILKSFYVLPADLYQLSLSTLVSGKLSGHLAKLWQNKGVSHLPGGEPNATTIYGDIPDDGSSLCCHTGAAHRNQSSPFTLPVDADQRCPLVQSRSAFPRAASDWSAACDHTSCLGCLPLRELAHG